MKEWATIVTATRLSIREVAGAGLMAAVVAAMGLLPPLYLPVSPTPITLQTMGVMLAGALLGRRGGALALLVFLALLAAGVPVLSGGRGGVAHLFGPGGGYILSFPLAAWVIGWWAERRARPGFWHLLAGNVAGGILLVYAVGAPVLALITGRSLAEALVAGALIYLPGDLLKAVTAAVVCVELHRRLPLRAGAPAPGAARSDRA